MSVNEEDCFILGFDVKCLHTDSKGFANNNFNGTANLYSITYRNT